MALIVDGPVIEHVVITEGIVMNWMVPTEKVGSTSKFYSSKQRDQRRLEQKISKPGFQFGIYDPELGALLALEIS